jgi:hypothetical protein
MIKAGAWMDGDGEAAKPHIFQSTENLLALGIIKGVIGLPFDGVFLRIEKCQHIWRNAS